MHIFCGAGMHQKSQQGAQKMCTRICNNFNPEMQENDETKWFQIQCSKDISPFYSLNKDKFFSTTQKNQNFSRKLKKQLTNEKRNNLRIN